MKINFVVVLALCVCVALVHAWDDSAVLPLHNGNEMQIFWTMTEESDGEYITIKAQTSTPGPAWIGLAWGASDGKMTNADMVCSSMQRGTWAVQEYWSTGFSTPVVDDEQDIQDVSAGYDSDEGVSWMIFTRKCSTGDSQDNDFVSGPMDVGYAVGRSGTFAKHKDAEHDTVTFF